MATGHGRGVLGPIRGVGTSHGSSSAVAVGEAVVSEKVEVSPAYERIVADHVVLDTGHVVVSGEPIGSPAPPPPQCAEFLLYCFLSKEDRAGLIGDLVGEYRTEVLPKFGPRRAKIWYWSQVVRSIAPVVFNFLEKWQKLSR